MPPIHNEIKYDKRITSGQDQSLLRMLCDNLEIGVSILDKDLNYLFISDLALTQMNLTSEQLKVGDNLSKCHELMFANGMLTPEIVEKNNISPEAQAKILKKGVEGNIDVQTKVVQLGDGSSHRFIRKTTKNGFTVSMATNISELVEKDNVLEQTLQLGKAGHWSYNFQTKEFLYSKSIKRFYTQDDLKKIHAHGVFSIIHPEDRTLYKEAIRKALNTNESRFEIPASRTINSQGETAWYQTVAELIRGNDGKLIKLNAFVRNIDAERLQSQELMQVKDEAIAASLAKSEFLANISHEIRTPMNGILGMTELLSHTNLSEQQSNFLNVLSESAAGLLGIMNNILDFSKIESGDVELNESPFDLKASINEVVDKMRSLAQIKGLELIINYPPSMLRGFIGDQKRLHQALENLVENAIKFTEHGHIVIEAKASKPRNDVSFITICVRDTGIGIAENKVDSIFQEFTQADSTSKRTHGGTGLGLSIARAIIEMMDGRITVDSQLGHGSSFKLNFPLSIDPNTDRRKYDRDALKGKRILIIDDLETNRHVLSEQLAYWTVDTKSVPNSERALAALNVAQAQNQPFDLILLDDLMPDMSGKRLAEEISKNNELNCIPIIMLSASNVTVCEETLSQLNIKFSLTKPVKAQILYDKISSVLTTGVKAESTKALDIDDTIDLNKNLIETRSPIDAPIEILIAEDLKLNQEVINLMFDETIYSPVFADNGQIALELYTTNPSRFAVILMDISMPAMDGYQTAREIISFNETRRLPHIPIIALTGHALKGDREKCFEIGMNDFLSKPVKRTDLIGKIESWISNSEKLSIIAS